MFHEYVHTVTESETVTVYTDSDTVFFSFTHTPYIHATGHRSGECEIRDTTGATNPAPITIPSTGPGPSNRAGAPRTRHVA